jgi:hypothetical protein
MEAASNSASHLFTVRAGKHSVSLGMMESIANTDERQETMDRAKRVADLERHEGGHWRVQRDLDPATIYARILGA